MSFLSPEQIRAALNQLGNEYETLTANRNKLEQDCNKLREHIEQQISTIQGLNQDLEKLRDDFMQRRDEFANRVKAAPAPAQAGTATENQPEEAAEQEYEVTPLMPVEKIQDRAQIALLAEILDISVICSTCFSPDGQYLAIGSNRTLRVYNIERGDFLFDYAIEESDDGASNHVRSLTWTPDSQRVICGGEDHHIRVVGLPEGTLIHSFEAGSGEIFQIQSSYKSDFFCSVNGDGSLSLWKLDDFSPIATMVRKPKVPTAAPTEKVEEGKPTETAAAQAAPAAQPSDEERVVATSLSISEDDKVIAVGYSDNVVALWNSQTHELISETVCHTKGVYAVKYLPGKKLLATSALDSTVKLWNITDTDGKIGLSLWKTLTGHTNYVLSLAVDPKGKWLVSGSKDLTVKVSSISQGEMIYDVKSHKNSVITVAFSPTGNVFCSGSGDQSVLIWSIAPDQTEEGENQ